MLFMNCEMEFSKSLEVRRRTICNMLRNNFVFFHGFVLVVVLVTSSCFLLVLCLFNEILYISNNSHSF